MVKRHVLISALLHLVVLVWAFFWLRSWRAPAPVEILHLTAGDVFVGGAPQKPVAAIPPAVPTPTESPAETTSSAASAPVATPEPEGGSQAGAIDGDARLGEGVSIVYPAMSVRLGESGKVTVALDIAADGSVTRSGLLRSSGFSRLDEEALDVLRSARFSAATRGGRPVASRKEITVEFRLKQGEPENIRIVP